MTYFCKIEYKYSYMDVTMDGSKKFFVGGYLFKELTKEQLLDKKIIAEIVGKQLEHEYGIIYCNIEHVIENVIIINA
jgi:hypothetical protein